MKIGQINNTAATAAVANNDRKAVDSQKKSAAPASTAGSESSTQVELSATASALSGEDDATFDSAKVDRIAQAIREGKFTVNHQAIADKLISNAQELLGRSGNSH
jgi:negative regulator of flagellin synthesis FlgM